MTETLSPLKTRLDDVVVIFDLDGTLVDSAPDLTAALNHVLTAEGLTPADPPEVRPLVGHGALALLRKGFALHGREFPDGEDGERLRAMFLDHYEDHIADHSAPFPGCEAALLALKQAGAAVTVCTNKIERLAFPLLEATGLLGHFELVFGRDTLAEYKPSGLPLTTLMERTGRNRGLMVGDTMTDVEAARAAGIACTVAQFGYGTFGPGQLRDAAGSGKQPTGEPVFASFPDLPPLIDSLFGK